MALELTLRYRDDDPWEVVVNAFEIIYPYLKPGSTASAASTATQLDALTPGKRQSGNEDVEESSSFLLEFWEVFLGIAKQLTYGHPSQDRLVDLAKELTRLATPSSETDVPMWRDLQYLGIVLQEQWREPTLSEDTFTPFLEWINLNSFVARIYGAGLFTDGMRFCVWTLRDALETSDSSPNDLQRCRLSAAAQCIKYGVAELSHVMQNCDPSEGEQRALSSPIFQGEKVFSLDRWTFWWVKFREASRLGLSDSTQTEIDHACLIMYRTLTPTLTQSTQYNSQQAPYDELRKTSIAIIERVNIRSIVLPFINDANVLDLACGSGFYTHAFLRWGARQAVGVDISSAMLGEARALDRRTNSNRPEFIEADCSEPFAYEGGPFDLVFGAWLLNYASTEKEMADFWRNIHLNLKPGGHFVGVTPPPTNDPAGHIEAECRIRPLPAASGGLYSTVNRHVDEGVDFHLHSDTPAGDLDFDTYHLRKDVWIAAAREAGFEGEIEWDVTSIPSDFMENPGKYGEQSNGRAKAEELETYAQVPHYGLIHVRK